MAVPPPADVTRLLVAWRGGDAAALARLVPLVYAELRRVAHRYMRDERPNHPLQTTALVHEAYLRLIDVTRADWQSRTHFFAVSAQLMRRILVEAAAGGSRFLDRPPWVPTAPAPGAVLTVGEVLGGRYEVRGVLGRGGMGNDLRVPAQRSGSPTRVARRIESNTGRISLVSGGGRVKDIPIAPTFP